jgi:predicted dienelactone hydrolase
MKIFSIFLLALGLAEAIHQSCDPRFNTGFGLGGLTLPPARNTSTAPPTGSYKGKKLLPSLFPSNQCGLISCFLGRGVGFQPPAWRSFSKVCRLELALSTANLSYSLLTRYIKVGVSFETYCFQGRSVTLNYWYPARHDNLSTLYVSSGGIVGEAVKNAPVDPSGGPYPMIIFSPGLAAVSDAYYFYNQNLASSGYIVVSIQHLDARNANFTSNTLSLTLAQIYSTIGDTINAVRSQYVDWFRESEFALTYRPQEIDFAYDQTVKSAANSSSPFYGVIDTKRIGMTGHSLGGFYTNIIGGGMPIYCDYAMSRIELDATYPILAEVSPCAFQTRKNFTGPFALHNPLVKAILPLAAPTFLTRSQIVRSAKNIRIPMMIITGDNKTSETTSWVQHDIYENASGPSHFLQLKNTNHYLVADSYGLNPVLSSSMSSGDKANFSSKAAEYMIYSTAFFDYYVKGNKSAMSILQMQPSIYVSEFSSRNLK